MNVPMTRFNAGYIKFLFNHQKYVRNCKLTYYTTSISLEPGELFTKEQLHKDRRRHVRSELFTLTIRNFMAPEDTDRSSKESTANLSTMTHEEINKTIEELLSTRKEKSLSQLILYCHDSKIFINEPILKKLMKHFSDIGRFDFIEILRKYCKHVNPILFKRNGEYLHYAAKAQCLKGNSEKGLNILKNAYNKYENLRSVYRIILRDLIHDAVSNRSEASLVIFKRFSQEFSSKYNDHHALVCLWHVCWSSSWFSDQMTSDELLESSPALFNIVKEKATAFSIYALNQDYNEDAVVHLLQILLKYEMMEEYVRVLQVLFSYKLKMRDVRGCSEIVRNCEVLGINLRPDQQGRFIKMVIDEQEPKTKSKEFELKF